jgi:1-phosphofructokinase family hexose kinase
VITAVALSPSVDVTYLVDEFTEGGTARPTAVVRVAGGKALNAARAAATIGAPVRAVAILGGASGEFIHSALGRAGVPVEVVRAAAETRTCVSVASAASGLLTEIYEHASAITPAELGEFHRVLARGTDAGWWLVSGGMPASVEIGELARLVELAHSLGHPVAIDSHGPALAAALVARPDLVKVNRAEAAEVLGATPDAAAFTLASRLHEITGGSVVVTDGGNGSFAVDGDTRWRATWSGRLGRYPVGSGDSYLGGLLAGLDRGDSFDAALRLAAGAATANALVPGAAVFAAGDAAAIGAEVVVSAG